MFKAIKEHAKTISKYSFVPNRKAAGKRGLE